MRIIYDKLTPKAEYNDFHLCVPTLPCGRVRDAAHKKDRVTESIVMLTGGSA